MYFLARAWPYSSDETGRNEVFVRPFPNVDAARVRVSTNGGSAPVWARSGRELFYRNGDAMMAVSVQTDPQFSASKPELLFTGKYWGNRWTANYDVTLDGRFLMIKPVDESPTTELHVVRNWGQEVRRLVEGEGQ